MTSRLALFVLVVVATLSALCQAGSIEDEFYRSIRSPSIDNGQAREGAPRDSWRKIVLDMVNYLNVLSDNADGIEKSLEDLWAKVDKLDNQGQQSYSLHYAKKLLNEQRAAIEALQSGSVSSSTKSSSPYSDLLEKTDEYVRPQQSYRKKEQQRHESPVTTHSGAYQALQGLRKL